MRPSNNQQSKTIEKHKETIIALMKLRLNDDGTPFTLKTLSPGVLSYTKPKVVFQGLYMTRIGYLKKVLQPFFNTTELQKVLHRRFICPGCKQSRYMSHFISPVNLVYPTDNIYKCSGTIFDECGMEIPLSVIIEQFKLRLANKLSVPQIRKQY